jgi:hypothetical protein
VPNLIPTVTLCVAKTNGHPATQIEASLGAIHEIQDRLKFKAPLQTRMSTVLHKLAMGASRISMIGAAIGVML